MGLLEGVLYPPVAIVGATAYANAQAINTVNGGFRNLGFRCSVATQSMTMKVQGSMDGTNFEDIVALKADNTSHSGAEIVVAAAAAQYFFITEAMGSPACFPFYRFQVKNTAAGVIGTATVSAFAK